MHIIENMEVKIYTKQSRTKSYNKDSLSLGK